MTIFNVTNLNDAGAGSLRAAITAANAANSASTINFSVSGSITLGSDLPDLTASVKIDATTAPGATPGGAPVVEISCNGNAGLTFGVGADNSSLLGVAVGGASGNGITLNSSDNTIAGDYVGLGTDGTALANGGSGIYVSSLSSGNTIGTNPTAASGVVSNVISGNAGNGIVLDGTSDNTLVNNYVGTDPTGTTAIANGQIGILVTNGASNNTIGGTAYTNTTTGAVNNPTGTEGTVPAVIVTPPLGNLVSGNALDGIAITNNSENNVLSGNFVGTTASGNAALGNGGDGIAIDGSNNNSLIGCTALDDPFVYYNVVSGNTYNGLHITNSDDVTVQANFFGIGANNATVVGNGQNGIRVDGSSSNVQVGGVIPLGNVAAGNGQNGIDVEGTVSHFITFNTFGGLFAFGGAAPNGNDGLLIKATGGHNTVQTNVFSGNQNNGIEIGGNASGVTVDPNIVGLATNGTSTLLNDGGFGNGNDGLLIDGTAHGNTIGSNQQSVIAQNLFSDNAAYGIGISGAAYDNTVTNSYVGLGDLGVNGFGNGEGGIQVAVSATGNTIGGPTGAEPTAVVVSANDGPGITLGAGTSNTTITNDIIGYGADGIKPLPNSGLPINPGLSTGNTINSNTVFACFAAGTRIGVPDGEARVEDLAVGDLVLTLSGVLQPIQWIGQRSVDCRRHPAPASIMPVRIEAHAFGHRQPAHALFLSPDHAIFFEGVFIPVKHLINGDSIRQIDAAAVTYFHIELPSHDVIFSEGLPSESYLQTGDRSSFASMDGVMKLHPLFGGENGDMTFAWDALGYAPLRVAGEEVVRARAVLQARAERRLREAVA
jgi:parallel beta-helix repeat protein